MQKNERGDWKMGQKNSYPKTQYGAILSGDSLIARLVVITHPTLTNHWPILWDMFHKLMGFLRNVPFNQLVN